MEIFAEEVERAFQKLLDEPEDPNECDHCGGTVTHTLTVQAISTADARGSYLREVKLCTNCTEQFLKWV